MISQIPLEIQSRLNSTDLKVLDLIVCMCRCQSKKSESRTSYCYPSEPWIGTKLSRTRETISRSVSKLHKMELLSVIHRRKYKGVWQTNLYRLGAKLLIILKRYKEAVKEYINRVTFSSHIVKLTTVNKEKGALEGVLRTRLQRKKEDPDQMLTELCRRHGCEYVKN